MRFFLSTFLFPLFFMMSCGDSSQSSSPQLVRPGDVKLSLVGLPASGDWDSVTVLVTAPDMSPIHITGNIVGSTASVLLEDIPPGDARLFEVQVFGLGGKLLYDGQKLADLARGQVHNLQVDLDALFARVEALVPVGVNNPMGIVGGLLTLTKGAEILQDSLDGVATPRIFRLETVLFGHWALEVLLWNSVGDTLFEIRDSLVVDASSGSIRLVLESLLTSVELEIRILAAPLEEVGLLVPGAVLRSPVDASDLVLSEFLANPKVSGNDFEWIEFFNGSLDSLDLSGCELRKSRSSSTSTSRLRLDSLPALAPGDYLVLGRDSVPFADASYTDFTLGNSGQDLLSFCGDSLLDSIAYTDLADSLNPFPLEVGRSMELSMENWATRLQGSSWTAGSESLDYGNGFVAQGSPGH